MCLVAWNTYIDEILSVTNDNEHEKPTVHMYVRILEGGGCAAGYLHL